MEEAERWGERVLQPVPRRLFRYLLLVSTEARTWMGTQVMRIPGAGLVQVDQLLADGTIGGKHPNAADFQILAGVRVLGEFEDLAALLDGRPCDAAARALFPEWVGPIARGLGDAQLSDGSAGIVAIRR